MAFTFGFYNAIYDQSTATYDRTYNAEQMSSLFDGIITDGVLTAAAYGDGMAVVVGEGMQVIVSTGRAWFNHTWNYVDSMYPLTIDTAEVVNYRIDAVVLEIDSSVASRTNRLRIVRGGNIDGQGGVADPDRTRATRPNMQHTEELNQYALAYVTVPPKATAIASANIENVIGTTETPYCTGLIQQLTIDQIMANWVNQFTELFNSKSDEADLWMQQNRVYFDEWFETIQTVLDGDVAGHLQNEIVSIEKTIILEAENWVGNIYTIEDELITANSNQEILEPVYSSNENPAQREAIRDADLIDGGQTTGSMTLIAFGDVPTINVPIRVIFRGLK